MATIKVTVEKDVKITFSAIVATWNSVSAEFDYVPPARMVLEPFLLRQQIKEAFAKDRDIGLGDIISFSVELGDKQTVRLNLRVESGHIDAT